jgi:O-antigen ligase
VFGMYQFLGDMVGIKPKFTFLREMYTKQVFGIPRIQGTANEPQLFAGMLFLPLAVFCVYFYFKMDNNPLNIKSKWSFPIAILTVLVFVLTISKGAFFAVILAILIILGFIAIKKFNLINYRKMLYLVPFLLIITFTFVGSPYLSTKIAPIIDNITGTVAGKSATSQERTSFINQANIILEDNPLFGIGSGQFGTYSSANNINSDSNNETLIVNNAYLELWLEYGVVTLLLFCLIIILTLTKLQKYIEYNIIERSFLIILAITLLSYLIQWSFFSPIYITPIFIIIGLCLNVSKINN